MINEQLRIVFQYRAKPRFIVGIALLSTPLSKTILTAFQEKSWLRCYDMNPYAIAFRLTVYPPLNAINSEF